MGLSNPDLLHPTSLVDMSYFILEDKFQQALKYDKAFEGRSWKEFQRYLVRQEFKYSPQKIESELRSYT